MTTSSQSTPVVLIERLIPAPPHRVYRAWLEPDLLVRWLAPGSAEVERVEVDERIGGRFRIWQRKNGQSIGGFECEFAELVPDQRIVLRWGFVGPERDAGPSFGSLLTVTFASAADGQATQLTLRHERLDELHRAKPEVARHVAEGWQLVFDKLDALCRG
jgi:uncharacterized protein YndB with AHSA1/START domain